MYIVCLHPENRNNNYIMMKVPEMKKEVKLILKHLKIKYQNKHMEEYHNVIIHEMEARERFQITHQNK